MEFLSELFTYGVLGMWTAYLIYKEQTTQQEYIRVQRELRDAVDDLRLYLAENKK